MIPRSKWVAAPRLAIVAVLFFCMILPVLQAFAAAFVAQVVKARGEIRINRDGTDLSGSTGTALQLGDVIKTGKDARLRLRFVDGSILTLGENTQLSIDLFAVDATNKQRTVVLTVLEGIVNAAASKSGESNFDYQIKTPSGYSAVRGTKWIVAFQKAVTSVYVLNGTVEMGSAAGTVPPVLINAGQWGSIDGAGAVSPVAPTTPELLQPVLDATSDTAVNTPPSTVPSQSAIPLPTITPTQPTPPKPPTRANKSNQSGGGGGKTGGGYGGNGGGTGTN